MGEVLLPALAVSSQGSYAVWTDADPEGPWGVSDVMMRILHPMKQSWFVLWKRHCPMRVRGCNTGFGQPLSGDMVKQNQLPLDNQCQSNNEKHQQGCHSEFSAENMGPGDTQDEENGCASEQILYREEQKGALFQVISHDRVQFFRTPAHQVEGEESVRNREEDHEQGRGKNPWAVVVGEGKIPHLPVP
jgi:hypothetical protein